jgi:hypothetical protein
VFEPAQGRLLSAFQTTCKLGVIVEEILDLDEEGPRYEKSTGTGRDEEEEFQKKSMETALRKKDALAKALTDWYSILPDQLNVDVTIPRPAPTHLIVNLAVSVRGIATLSANNELNVVAVTVVPFSCDFATLAIHLLEARTKSDNRTKPDWTVWRMPYALCECRRTDRGAGPDLGEEQTARAN